MDVRLMGPVEVAVDGAAVEGLRPKTRAVLALLALAPGRLHSVDSLVDGLWADDPPPSAATSLRSQISRLRAVLPAGAITTVGAAYRLDLRGGSVDVDRFEAAAREAASARDAGDLAEAERALAGAVLLWRGDAVPELGDSPRGLALRRRLDEHRASIVEDHAALLGELDRLVEGIAELEAHCQAAPYREEAWALLMRLLARAGRQADALDAYQRARQRLTEDLGIEPGATLRATEAEILAMGTDVPVRPRRLPDGSGQAPSARTAVAPGPNPFVGRADDLARIVSACTSPVPAGVTVLVDGPAGIGKSRLVEEARALVASQAGDRSRWLTGQCEEGLELAYQPVVTALRSRPVDEVTAAAAAMPEPLRASFGRILPEVLDGDPVTAGAGSREALFEALRLVLGHLGSDHDLVLVLEDLHWSSPDTVEAVRYLMACPPPCGLRVVLTYRGAELSAEHPLHGAVAAARRRGTVEVALGPLHADDVRDLVRGTAPDLPEGRVADLVEQAGGSPLFATELLKDAVDQSAAGEGGAPAGIVDLVEQRLRRLSPVTRRLLQTGSLVGRSFTLDVVAAVEGVTEGEALDALEPAVRAGLVEEGEGVGRFTFAHALLQDAVVGTLGGATRQGLLMWQVGEAAERSYLLDGRARADLTARAFSAGAETGDPGRAVEAGLVAADAALAAFDATAAIAMYDLVRSVLDRCGDRLDDPRRPRYRAERGLTDAHLLHGEAGLGEAVAAARRALAVAAELRDDDLVVACVDVVHRARAQQFTPVETVDLCREADAALAGASEVSRSVVLAAWGAAHCSTYTGRRADVARLFREAIRIADGVDDDEVRRTVFGLAYESGAADDLRLDVERLRDEYLGACARSSSPIVRAWGDLASCTRPPAPGETPEDTYARCIEVIDRVRAVATREFRVDVLAMAEYMRTGVMLRAGALGATAERLLGRPEAEAPVDRLARRLGRYTTAHRVGELLYHRDELASLVDSTGALVDTATTTSQLLNWSGGHALALADAGDDEGVRRVLDMIDASDLIDVFVGGTTVYGWLVEAAWRVGHRPTMAACIPRLEVAGAAEAGLSLHGTPALWNAVAHACLGEVGTADRLFDVGRQECLQLGQPLFANLTDALQARLRAEHDLAPPAEVATMVDRARRSAAGSGQRRALRLLDEVPTS